MITVDMQPLSTLPDPERGHEHDRADAPAEETSATMPQSPPDFMSTAAEESPSRAQADEKHPAWRLWFANPLLPSSRMRGFYCCANCPQARARDAVPLGRPARPGGAQGQ